MTAVCRQIPLFPLGIFKNKYILFLFALSKTLQSAEWVALVLIKASFTENFKFIGVRIAALSEQQCVFLSRQVVA